jgi:hypothetical protein
LILRVRNGELAGRKIKGQEDFLEQRLEIHAERLVARILFPGDLSGPVQRDETLDLMSAQAAV